MKKIIVLTGLVLFIVPSYAQTKNGRIIGEVKDVNQKNIESTVSLLHSKDSSLVKLGITDRKGDFEFEKIADVKYLVSNSDNSVTEFNL